MHCISQASYPNVLYINDSNQRAATPNSFASTVHFESAQNKKGNNFPYEKEDLSTADNLPLFDSFLL